MLSIGEEAGGRERPVTKFVTKRGPAEILHREEWRTVSLAGFVDGRDGGMVECRDGSRLTQEPCSRGGVGEHGVLQDFDGNGAAEDFVGGTIDDAHAAFADAFLDKVVSEPLRFHEGILAQNNAQDAARTVARGRGVPNSGMLERKGDEIRLMCT